MILTAIVAIITLGLGILVGCLLVSYDDQRWR